MTFKHKGTFFEIKRLTYTDNKWTYSIVWEWRGHFKPMGLNDTTFNLSWINEDSYKLTFEWNMEVLNSDKIIIDWEEYNVKDNKTFSWIDLKTQKILLTR